LIGFESLNPQNLKRMHKGFNQMKGGYEVALANLRRHGIRLYVTFILGYDDDSVDTFEETLEFAMKHRFYMVAFNHLTPFPGTPLYRRLEDEDRLTYDKWWLDPEYRYGMVPFEPRGMSAEEVRLRCIETRARFYSYPSMFKRSLDFEVNASDFFMWRNFFVINAMMRREVTQRKELPMGDAAHEIELVRASHTGPFDNTPAPSPLDIG
jgi:radical SAM superfamily enzyme YgiQ (UPF0313 family)